jgi:two-component system, NarL family, sensor kinase
VLVRTHDSDRPETRGAAPPASVGSAVGRFLLGSLVAVAVVVVGGFFALRSVTIGEAERNTREQVQIVARLVESAGLTDGVLRGDPDALLKLDDLVQAQVLSPSIVRVKMWTRDGRILYSDEPRIIGQRYELGDEERELFATGGAAAELSDLDQPENRYERQEGKLLEAHTPIRTPDGTQVLFEMYRRFGSVSASAERLLRALAPPLLAGLLVLLLIQIPLAWGMARRVQRGHRERERLLASAIEASDTERRRIAADLHDGVVQDLAGVAFGLAPVADDLDRRGDGGHAGAVRDATVHLRQGIRDLRSMLVELHPPRLESAGLEPALSDLLSPLEADGLRTELHVEDAAARRSEADALIYRAAREAVRNVRAHAQATTVRVRLTRPERGVARLVVEDDGRGFDEEDRERSRREGHVGLTLLEELVRQADGRLDIRSAPGEGTTVELEVPAR